MTPSDHPNKRSVYISATTEARLQALGGATRAENIRRALDLAKCAEDLAFWLRQALLDIEDQETEDRACEALKMFEEAKHVD